MCLIGKKKKVKFHLKAEGVLSIRAMCVYDTSVVTAGGEFKEYCPSRIRMISLCGFVVWLSQMSVTCDMNLRSSLSKWSTTQNSPVPAFDLFTFPGWRTGRLTRVTLFTGASWELVGDERSMQMSSFNQSPSCLQLWARSNLLAQELPSLRMVKDSYMAHPPSPSLCLALMIPICRSRMFFLEGGGKLSSDEYSHDRVCAHEKGINHSEVDLWQLKVWGCYFLDEIIKNISFWFWLWNKKKKNRPSFSWAFRTSNEESPG